MKQIVSILLAFTFSQNIIAQTKIITELFNDYYILKQGNKFGLSKDTINVTYKYDSIYASKFEDYIFVSPEETLQLDPNIHNARGLGSTNIVEGASYAVIRRTSRQTVIYAEVKVN